MMQPRDEVDRVILELEGIVWEAREAGFFSIDDVEEMARQLKGIDWDSRCSCMCPKNHPSWLKGFGAWLAIPFFVILIPFGYLYSFVFQRK